MHALRELYETCRARPGRLAALGCYAGLLLIAGCELPVRASAAWSAYAGWRAAEERVTAVQTLAEASRSLRTREERLERRRARLLVRLPRGDEMSAVLGMLQEAARSTGAEVEEVRAQPRAASGSYDVLPVELVVTGSWGEIGSFTRTVERSAYLVRVRRLDVEPAEEAGPTLRAALSCEVVILGGAGRADGAAAEAKPGARAGAGGKGP